MVQSAVIPTKRLSLAKGGIMILQEGAKGTLFNLRAKTPVILQDTGNSSQIAKVVVESIPILASAPERFSIDGTTGKKVAIDKGTAGVVSRTVVNFSVGGAMLKALVAGALSRLGDGAFPTAKDVVVRVAGTAATQENVVAGGALLLGPTYSFRIANAGKQFPIVPGSVKITYTIGAANVLMDLWGDGRLVGRHGFGTVDYETGECTITLSAVSSATITADFEAVDNSVAFANSAADVEASYEQSVQSLTR